ASPCTTRGRSCTTSSTTSSTCSTSGVTPEALLAAEEEADRVSRRIQHDADALGIAGRRLPRRLLAALLLGRRARSLQILDLDLEVQHLHLLPRLRRPRRRFVPLHALDVEVQPGLGVTELRPTRSRGFEHVVPEDALVEAGDGTSIRAVDG